MKNWIAFLCVFVAGASVASAQSSLSTQAQQVALKIQNIEGSLHAEDAEEIAYALGRVERILSRYQGQGSTRFTCVSNGGFGGFEKFQIVALGTGKRLGGETSAETCQRLIRQQKNGLICASNGGFGGFEKFALHHANRGQSLGGETSLETCTASISTSSMQLACVSNGGFGGFEKFTLIDLLSGQRLGGETTFETCRSSIR